MTSPGSGLSSDLRVSLPDPAVNTRKRISPTGSDESSDLVRKRTHAHL